MPTRIRSDPVTLDPSPHLTSAWLDAFLTLSDLPATRREIVERTLSSVPTDACFATLRSDGNEPLCTALAVLDEGHLGLFDVVTHPAHRRRGHARRLISALLSHARHRGATRAYLQVMLSNTPALALYASMGFVEHHQYWYRVRPHAA